MAFAPAGANKPFGNPAATPGGGIPFGASTPAVGAAATGAFGLKSGGFMPTNAAPAGAGTPIGGLGGGGAFGAGPAPTAAAGLPGMPAGGGIFGTKAAPAAAASPFAVATTTAPATPFAGGGIFGTKTPAAGAGGLLAQPAALTPAGPGAFQPAGGGIFAAAAPANQAFGAGGAAATQTKDPTVLATTAAAPNANQSKTGSCLLETVEPEVQDVFDKLQQLVDAEDLAKRYIDSTLNKRKGGDHARSIETQITNINRKLRRVKAEVYQAKEAAGNLQAKTEEERWITAAGGIFEDEPMQMDYGASASQHYMSEQSNMVYNYYEKQIFRMEKDIVGYQEHVSILMEQMKPSVTTQDEVDALEMLLKNQVDLFIGLSSKLYQVHLKVEKEKQLFQKHHPGDLQAFEAEIKKGKRVMDGGDMMQIDLIPTVIAPPEKSLSAFTKPLAGVPQLPGIAQAGIFSAGGVSAFASPAAGVGAFASPAAGIGAFAKPAGAFAPKPAGAFAPQAGVFAPPAAGVGAFGSPAPAFTAPTAAAFGTPAAGLGAKPPGFGPFGTAATTPLITVTPATPALGGMASIPFGKKKAEKAAVAGAFGGAPAGIFGAAAPSPFAPK